jgi:3-mercaptopyruvate sulfurtransferase SseA
MASTTAARAIPFGSRPVAAARVWLMLRAFGFDNAAVLDGGLTSSQAENPHPSSFPPTRPFP